MSPRFRSKTLAIALALVLGGVGAHRFYLVGVRCKAAWALLLGFVFLLGAGLRHALASDPTFGYNLPWDLFRPAIVTIMLPVVIAHLDALILGLLPDARFDERFNSSTPRKNHSGGGLVTLVALCLFVGTLLLVIIIVVNMEAAVMALPHHTLDEPTSSAS